VIEGELRFIDVERNRVLLAEPFDIEISGAKQIQAAPDGDKNDPDLYLTPMEKQALFDRLEEKLAGKLFKKVSRFTGRR
jgi:hypothetical protein